MLPCELFRFCPRCGGKIGAGANPLRCPDCGFRYFFNPTLAAAAFVYDETGRAIFIRRSKEPKKGLLTIPGGFVDLDETAEIALEREVREEVGLEIEEITYITSEINRYPFDGVEYPVCDLIFTAKAKNPHEAKALDGAAEYYWLNFPDVIPEQLAFPSVKKGWELLINKMKQ
jgi:ADP-ribose pyrophosphatase YjhB (NUDIX family)